MKRNTVSSSSSRELLGMSGGEPSMNVVDPTGESFGWTERKVHDLYKTPAEFDQGNPLTIPPVAGTIGSTYS